MAATKYLNDTGLSTFWNKIKTYIASSISGLATSEALTTGLAGKADTTALDDYAKTTALADYAKSTDVESTYAKKSDIENFQEMTPIEDTEINGLE